MWLFRLTSLEQAVLSVNLNDHFLKICLFMYFSVSLYYTVLRY
jgi:hypothetical protein